MHTLQDRRHGWHLVLRDWLAVHICGLPGISYLRTVNGTEPYYFNSVTVLTDSDDL